MLDPATVASREVVGETLCSMTDPSALPEPPRTGFRDEKTVAAEERTTKWEGPPGFRLSPDVPPPESRGQADPLFWPVVVFVAVFVACIGVFLVSQPSRPAAQKAREAQLLP